MNSDHSQLLQKLKSIAKKAGRTLILSALTFWFALRDPQVPRTIKAIILGDLAYLISPIDLVPDIIPGIGFSDDMGVLAATAILISRYLTKEHVTLAQQTCTEWFGET